MLNLFLFISQRVTLSLKQEQNWPVMVQKPTLPAALKFEITIHILVPFLVFPLKSFSFSNVLLYVIAITFLFSTNSFFLLIFVAFRSLVFHC